MKLVNEDTGIVHPFGTPATSFRGETFIVEGGRFPTHEGSTGRVWVRSSPGETVQEFFPSVFNLRWEA